MLQSDQVSFGSLFCCAELLFVRACISHSINKKAGAFSVHLCMLPCIAVSGLTMKDSRLLDNFAAPRGLTTLIAAGTLATLFVSTHPVSLILLHRTGHN